MAGQPQSAEQQALIALQTEMGQTRAQLAHVSSRFDQMAAAHASLQAAHDKLRDDAGRILNERQAEIQQLERSLAGVLKKQHCDLLDLKAMQPSVFTGAKNERWRPWARRIKSYCNAKHTGFKKALEWAEAQPSEITNLAACPWNRATDMDAILYEFLGQCMTGHAGLLIDRKELEERGFEVWRRAHAQYSPMGPQYETDMLQSLLAQGPAKDMAKLAEATERFEHDWRRYEQESGEVLPEKIKGVIIVKMFPPHHYADEIKNRYQQGLMTYQQVVDNILSYGQLLRNENAFKRGDTDAMAVDSVEGPKDQHVDSVGTARQYTEAETKAFYSGYEDAFVDDAARSVDPNTLDRPLAAMYRKGLGKGKQKKGKGKGPKGGNASTGASSGGGGQGGKGSKAGKGKGKKISRYCHKRGHDEADGCWAKERGEPRATGPLPVSNVEDEAEWTNFEAVEEMPNTGILRDAGTLERYLGSIDDDKSPGVVFDDVDEPAYVFDDDGDDDSSEIAQEYIPSEIGMIGNEEIENVDRDVLMLSMKEFESFGDDGADRAEDIDATIEIVPRATESKFDLAVGVDLTGGTEDPWHKFTGGDPWSLGSRSPPLMSQAQTKLPDNPLMGDLGIVDQTTVEVNPTSLSEELKRMNSEVEANRIDIAQLFSRGKARPEFVDIGTPSSIAPETPSPIAGRWREPRPKRRVASGPTISKFEHIFHVKVAVIMELTLDTQMRKMDMLKVAMEKWILEKRILMHSNVTIQNT